ncbi:hypothetical protein LIER_16672 [Lithospermum erythrorhizon]|uniref:Uncharacterized protein n=1 Tax=Lithospermum erythrorhizon TaxID=34254 RepID=A0AAV3QBQ6_LITER
MIDITAAGTIWQKTPTQLFNIFESLGTDFQDITEEVPSPTSEEFNVVEELKNDSAIVVGVDSIPYVEKLGEIEDLDAIVEWVDMTKYFELKNIAFVCITVLSLLHYVLKLVHKLELHKSVTSKEMTKCLLAYKGVGYYSLGVF